MRDLQSKMPAGWLDHLTQIVLVQSAMTQHLCRFVECAQKWARLLKGRFGCTPSPLGSHRESQHSCLGHSARVEWIQCLNLFATSRCMCTERQFVDCLGKASRGSLLLNCCCCAAVTKISAILRYSIYRSCKSEVTSVETFLTKVHPRSDYFPRYGCFVSSQS